MSKILAKDIVSEIKQAGDADRNFYRYDTMRSVDYNFILELVKKLKPKNTLEVGCAYGCLSLLLTRNGFLVKTIDILPKLHSQKLFRKYGVPFKKANIETDPVPYKEKFDLIILSEVMEHFCSNPLPTLKKLVAKLKRGGRLILSVPMRELDPPEKRGLWTEEINWRQIPVVKKYKWKDGHHHHYYFWELVDLIKEAGLKISYMAKRQGWFLVLKKI